MGFVGLNLTIGLLVVSSHLRPQEGGRSFVFCDTNVPRGLVLADGDEDGQGLR